MALRKLMHHRAAMMRRARLKPLIVYRCSGWQMARKRSIVKATIVSTDTYVDLWTNKSINQSVGQEAHAKRVIEGVLTPPILMLSFCRTTGRIRMDIDASTGQSHWEHLQWWHRRGDIEITSFKISVNDDLFSFGIGSMGPIWLFLVNPFGLGVVGKLIWLLNQKHNQYETDDP